MPTSEGVMEELIQVLSKRLDDHDILVRLVTQMDGLITDVRQNNNLTAAGREDHEKRIRDLEAKTNWLWGALGIGCAGSVALAKYLGG